MENVNDWNSVQWKFIGAVFACQDKELKRVHEQRIVVGSPNVASLFLDSVPGTSSTVSSYGIGRPIIGCGHSEVSAPFKEKLSGEAPEGLRAIEKEREKSEN